MRSAAFFVRYRRDNRRKTSCGFGVNFTQVGISCFAPCANKCNAQLFAIARQQFEMGINCSIFLHRNSFRANQRLALTGKSFRIAQVSHCVVQRV